MRVRVVAMSAQAKSKKISEAGRRRRPGSRRPATDEEVRLLRPISEHGTVTLDQLVRLVGLSEDEGARRFEGLVALGWARTRRYVGFEGEWLSLRDGGAKRSGTGLSVGELHAGELMHRHAITEARLALCEEMPGAEWICEREYWRGPRDGAVVPDGVILVGGTRVAIEVELSAKAAGTTRRMMVERCGAFDRVIYLCPPGKVRRLIEKVAGEVGGEAVVVRDLPVRRLGESSATGGRGRHEPDAEELAAIRLINEEGLVAVRQLGPLLGLGEAAGVDLSRRLEERNFIRRDFSTEKEQGWLRCTRRSAELSGTGVAAYVPTGASGLEDRLTLGRIRMRMRELPGYRDWLTRRVVVRGLPGPRRCDLPVAMVESDSGRQAVLLVRSGRPSAGLRRDLCILSERFDGVLCFVEEVSVERVERYVAALDLENVEISEMP
jgi:hypothetical protein